MVVVAVVRRVRRLVLGGRLRLAVGRLRVRAGVSAGGADAVFIGVRLGSGLALLRLLGDHLAAVVAGHGHRDVHAPGMRFVVHGGVDGGQFLARFVVFSWKQ